MSHEHHKGCNHGHARSHEVERAQKIALQPNNDIIQDHKVEEKPLHRIEEIIVMRSEDGANYEAPKLDEYNMWAAAALGDFAFLKQVLLHFPHIISSHDNDGQYLLHWAALINNVDAAARLLRAGAEVDVLAKKTSQTPLMWAATRGNIEMINLLISYGANPHHRDSIGANALIIAVQYKEILTAHFLMSKGFSATAPDNTGCNSVHWAAYMGVVPLLRLFHTKAPDADQKDDLGYTPLHRAVFGNCEEAVQFFVEKKYDLRAVTKKGETALDMAMAMKRSPKMIKMLSNNQKTASGLKSLYSHPKFMEYLFPVLWVVVYTLTFHTFYSKMLTYLMEGHAVAIMLLGLSLIAHGCLYFYVARSDPGYVGDEARVDLDSMVQNIQDNKQAPAADKICFTCDIQKPVRSKHCRQCDRCVYRFDHHCGWTNNCVGQMNHPAFVSFVCAQEIVHVFTLYLSFCAMKYLWSEDTSIFWNIFGQPELLFMIFVHIMGIGMTGALVKQHIEMVLKNETTNEVMNWARYPHFWKPVTNSKDGRKGLAYTNPFHQGMSNNVQQFCFGTIEPSEQTMFAKLDSVHIVAR